MWTALLGQAAGGLFSQGAAASSTFNQTTQGILAAELQRQDSKRMRTYAIAGVSLAGIGLLAYFLTRR